MHRRPPVLDILFTVILLSCVDTMGLSESKAASIEADMKKFNHEFTLDAYNQLLKINNEHNVFFSPFSISVAMSMVYLGAGGNTKSQMKSGMKLHAVDEYVHSAFEQYLPTVVSSDSNCTLSIANKLYPHMKVTIPAEYLKLCKKHYRTDVESLNFGDSEKSRNAINEWVSDQTAEKITDLIPSGVLDDLTLMVLVNAIYFKGNWAKQFKVEATSSAPFHNLLGQQKMVDMMTQTDKFPFKYDPKLKCGILKLSYVGDSLSMVVILPDSGTGLEKLEADMTPAFFQNLDTDFDNIKVHVSLPKFKLELSFELSKMFQNMGITDLFDEEKANLVHIDPKKITYVSKVFHKAFVDVNEEGTEAAAATAAVIQMRSLPRIYEFNANHPFIFLIRDNKTGVILFMGRFADVPNKVQGKEEL